MVGVAMAALVAMTVAFSHHWRHGRERWTHADGDAHSHYWFAYRLADDVRRLDAIQWLEDINSARMWPPLHGLIASGFLVALGPDVRFAVLPSLISWGATIILSFLIARRLAPRAGVLAGLLPAMLLIASSSHRWMATDIMLDTLGGALTLAILLAYLRWREQPTLRRSAVLGTLLTLLFLEKYHYYAMIALPLFIVEIVRAREPIIRWLMTQDRSTLAGWLNHERRRPTTWLLLAIASTAATIAITGGGVLTIGSWTIAARDSRNLLHALWLIVLLRAVGWRLREGGAAIAAWSPSLRGIFYSHVVPLSLWFALPLRLGYLVYFLTKRHTSAEYIGLAGGAKLYWSWAQEFYHPAPWIASIVLALTLLAVWKYRQARPGIEAVLLFVLIAGFATIAHPHKMSRCLHTWIGAAWILAGVGMVSIIRAKRSWLEGPVALIPLLAIAMAIPFFYPDAGKNTDSTAKIGRPCLLDLPDYYLPMLEGKRSVAIWGTLPMASFESWTYQQRFPLAPRPEVILKHFGSGREENQRRFDDWIKKTSIDAMVLIDVDEQSPFQFPDFPQYAQFRELVAGQQAFRLTSQKTFASHGATISIYERATGPSAIQLTAQPISQAR